MDAADIAVIGAMFFVCILAAFGVWSINRPNVVEFHPEPRANALNWHELIVVAAVNRRIQVTSDWIASVADDARATHAVSGTPAAIDVLEAAFRALDEAKSNG